MSALPPISSLTPSLPTLGDIADIGSPAATTPAGDSSATGFASMVADQIGKLEQTQQAADQAQTALATGQTQDVTSVVLATEKASLDLNLAANIRSEMVGAYQQVLNMQV